MRVIAYARVSTEEQSVRGVSIDAQVEKLKAYASLYDLEVIEVIIDAGVSAKTLNRDGLQKALRLLKTGKADGLVVAKLDRLSRSVSDWNQLIDGYFSEKAGKSLFSVNDAIDTRTAGGRLVLNVLMSVAQWEREAIAERTKTAMAYKKSQGERISGRLPYGFALDGDGISLVEIPAEQEALRTIRTMRERGHTFRAIAEHLNKSNVPTKTGGAAWRHSAVASILGRSA